MMAELDILNGFAGKVISDCIDISINAIKKADKNRKSKNQTMETRIYQVTVDTLNAFPYNKYKKDEKVYDAAEIILKELKKGNGDYKESVRLGLNMLSAEITGDICDAFLGLLCDEIRREENRDIAIGHIIHQGEKISEQQLQMDRHMQEGFKKSYQNEKEILKVTRDVKYSLDKMNRGKCYKTANKRSVINRAEEYAEKWNKNVFLNDFNEEDENAGINIKLREIYVEECLPHYIWKNNSKSSDKLRNLLAKYIINDNDRKMLLILGQPGIGKSTLITWIMTNLAENNKQILVYQFAADLKTLNWQNDSILDQIFVTIDLEYSDLEGKTLIFDGFDEIYMKGDRERILYKMNQELEKSNNLKNFSLIITCRENYVDKLGLRGIEYITLQAWDEKQIQRFCEIYEEVNSRGKLQTKTNRTTSIKTSGIVEKKDIMGIPLILYMVLALNVDIGRSSSIVDIYDQIFSLKGGGIYDRGYDIEHRINASEIKKHIHHISQQIAFWIFENNADKATISQEKFERICENEMKELGKKGKDIQADTLIGNFFKLNHSEGKGTDELQFVHRSIYEYFVVIYFYESIYKLKFKEEIAGKLGELLKDGHLSKQILELMKYKFDDMKGLDLPDVVKEIFNIMLRDGMTYHAKSKYKNIIIQEMNVFSNMLSIVSLWNDYLGNINNKIVVYLQHNRMSILYLRGINLRGADLRGADLSRADLRGADLRGADLSGADLRRTDLNEADLRGADLSEADLGGADLIEADLRGADLRRADLRGTDLSGANLRNTHLRGADLNGVIFDENQVKLLCKEYNISASKVYFPETEEEISYNEYCIRKQKLK